MSKKTIAILKSYFSTGNRPTELQFSDLIDSFIHKDNAGITITSKSYNDTTGVLSFAFSDGSNLTATIPKSAEISFINGLQEALNLKVSKETGKGLSTNDYSNDEKSKVTAGATHIADDTKHVSELKAFIWANKLKEYISGEEIIQTIENTYRIADNSIFRLNISSGAFPYVCPAEIVLTDWIAVLDLSEKLNKSGYGGTANDLYNSIQLLSGFIAPLITLNGNPFILKKHPTNNLAESSGILQNNDFILNGFWGDTEFWGLAQCLDATDAENVLKWTIFNSTEDLIIIT
jgi:hypothetical protein